MKPASALPGAAALCAALISIPSPADEPVEAPPQASTDAVERCVAEHERASMLRLKEKWLEAREQMTACAQEICPLVIRSDCRIWLEELAKMMPTLLVVVESDDAGQQRVRLELDGRPLDLSDPAQPIEVSPGPHRLRIILPPYPPVEREVVLQPGEKNRLVRVRFAQPPRPPAAAPEAQPAPPRASRPIPVPTYLLSGGALVSFATSGVLLASALSSLGNARDECAPACEHEDRESIETRLLMADISAGVGLVLGGLAVYTFATRPVVYDRSSQIAPSISLGRNAAELSLGGRF
jgi:hypothetical protein